MGLGGTSRGRDLRARSGEPCPLSGAEVFGNWKCTGQRDVDPASAYWTPWVELIRSATARGVAVRRARIVSEPVTDYIRYEHAGTVVNVHAGERVRRLSRRQASDIALPGNDCWVFDGETVLFNHFSGDGNWSEPMLGGSLRTGSSAVGIGCVRGRMGARHPTRGVRGLIRRSTEESTHVSRSGK